MNKKNHYKKKHIKQCTSSDPNVIEIQLLPCLKYLCIQSA